MNGCKMGQFYEIGINLMVINHNPCGLKLKMPKVYKNKSTFGDWEKLPENCNKI
jgi:hypothetical protein